MIDVDLIRLSQDSKAEDDLVQFVARSMGILDRKPSHSFFTYLNNESNAAEDAAEASWYEFGYKPLGTLFDILENEFSYSEIEIGFHVKEAYGEWSILISQFMPIGGAGSVWLPLYKAVNTSSNAPQVGDGVRVTVPMVPTTCIGFSLIAGAASKISIQYGITIMGVSFQL